MVGSGTSRVISQLDGYGESRRNTCGRDGGARKLQRTVRRRSETTIDVVQKSGGDRGKSDQKYDDYYRQEESVSDVARYYFHYS